MSFSTLSLAAFGAGAACIAAAPAGTFRRPSNARRMQDDTGAVDGAAAGATGTPYVSFCPSIQGTDSGMWADLYNVEETNNYQVGLFSGVMRQSMVFCVSSSGWCRSSVGVRRTGTRIDRLRHRA